MVAVSVAFGVYIPVLRSNGKLLRGFAPRRRPINLPPYSPNAASVRREPAAPALALAPFPAGEPQIQAAPWPAVHALAAEPVAAEPVAAVPHLSPAVVADAPQVSTPRERPEAFSVLIVDDNAINRQVLAMILDSVGVAHTSVENGLQAVEAMQARAFDAVLMDLQMPVMDGFEATRRIRALEAAHGAQRARIIVVSANCADEDIAEGRAAGADRHLPKPVSAAAVIGELAACPTVERLAA